MHLGQVLGTVVATKKSSGLSGVKLYLLQPYDDNGKVCGDPMGKHGLGEDNCNPPRLRGSERLRQELPRRGILQPIRLRKGACV